VDGLPTQTKSQIIIPQAGKQDKQRQVIIKRYVLYKFFLLMLLTVGVLSGYLLKRQSGIRNVILISIDTCRADHLGCYGFERETTDHIDEIAGEGIVFKNAHTPVPLTLPAHCSMLTGTFPPYHQVHDNLGYKLSYSQ